MILSLGYDVEVLPNFFSVTFIDLNDYLNTFKDCCITDSKGKSKPIPLVQKYTVKEIKKKLDVIKHYSFYITDTDDSMLLPMLGFINKQKPHRDENGIAIRTDVFGFNSSAYDKIMIAGLLMYANNTNSTKELITKLYELSKHIIEIQNDKELLRTDYVINTFSKYPLPFINVDVMTIFALNKVGSGVNDKGETIYFGKSLKQTSINLQWYELLEYELPPISEKDVELYTRQQKYSGMTIDQLNKLVDKWDRYIIPEWIDDTMYYNKNDVFIVCEMIRLYIDEIRLRYNICSTYKIDVLSSSRSNIADKMFEKFYSDFSGLAPREWKGKKTERKALSMKKVIFPFIKFKTKPLQELLEELSQIVLYSIGKKAIKEVAYKYPNFKYLKTDTKSGWFEITINKLTYTIATGGLHSKDIPRELKSKLIDINYPSTGELLQEIPKDTNIWDVISDDSYIYVHWDIASFYPSIMDEYSIAPKHMNEKIFVKLIHWLKETRVQAKHSKEDYIDGIPKGVLAQVLKIVINSIYGKLGYEYGDLCDRLAVLKVTINGQLMIMMLCEELELNGIEVASANTDGIVIKLYKRDKAKFEEIANNWKKLTKLGADSEEYLCYINRDINNYFVKEINGKFDSKGALNPLMYATDLSKGYDMPIVAQAVVNFFLYDIPILESLYNCQNILDFCKTQNVGRQFHVEYTEGCESKILQRNVRFYVSNSGGSIEKVNNVDNSRGNLCAGHKVTILNSLDDSNIAFRNIKYSYYYDEAMKIINPIKLQISPNKKGDRDKCTKSGKALLKKYSGQFNMLFDDAEE